MDSHFDCLHKVSENEAGPLTGVVICVGKKLSKMQSELNAVAASLGADFRYKHTSGHCEKYTSTHFTDAPVLGV